MSQQGRAAGPDQCPQEGSFQQPKECVLPNADYGSDAERGRGRYWVCSWRAPEGGRTLISLESGSSEVHCGLYLTEAPGTPCAQAGQALTGWARGAGAVTLPGEWRAGAMVLPRSWLVP